MTVEVHNNCQDSARGRWRVRFVAALDVLTIKCAMPYPVTVVTSTPQKEGRATSPKQSSERQQNRRLLVFAPFRPTNMSGMGNSDEPTEALPVVTTEPCIALVKPSIDDRSTRTSQQPASVGFVPRLAPGWAGHRAPAGRRYGANSESCRHGFDLSATSNAASHVQ